MSNFVFSHLICDGRLRVDSNLRLERKAQHIFAAGSVFNKLYDDPSLLGVRNTCCVVVFHLKKPPVLRSPLWSLLSGAHVVALREINEGVAQLQLVIVLDCLSGMIKDKNLFVEKPSERT